MPLALTASVGLAVLLPGRLALLVLPPLALLPQFAGDVRAGHLGRAARRSLLWALLLSILTIASVMLCPERMQTRIFHGPAYLEEMLGWVKTGIGREGDIRQFLPEHVLHLSALLVGSFVSGGALGLFLGCFLLSYMNYYVANLLLLSKTPLLTALFAWHVWSVVRVVGFVLAAIAVAKPLYGRFRSVKADLLRGKKLLVIGLTLAALDVLLKYLLADTWHAVLNKTLTG